MKKLTAIAATLIMLLVTSTADAGIFYGHGFADGIGRAPVVGGFFRTVGGMERQKDMWIFGRPILVSPRYQDQGSNDYYQQPYYQAPVQKSVPPMPEKK